MNGKHFLLTAVALVPVLVFSGPAAAQTQQTDSDHVSFETSVGAPFTLDFDTGWLPPSSDLQFKAFFYAGAGEAHARYAGTFTASWDSASAVPGNTVTVTITAAGDPDDSTWESDAGVRYGVRYKIDTGVGRVDYFKEDYVPYLPNLDLSFPAPEDTFMAFGLGQLLSERHWEFGAAGNCLYTVGDEMGGCYSETSFSLNPDVDFFCSIEVADTAKTSEGDPGEVEIELRPTPPMAFSAGAEFGLCFDLAIGTDRFDHGSSSESITPSSPSMSFDIYLPCDLANRTQGSPREHHFTIDDVLLDVDAAITLVGRINPTFAVCLAELVEVSIAPNIGVCFVMPFTISLPDFDFPAAKLGYTIPIADPVVRNIRPDQAITTNFVDPVPVYWETSWDLEGNPCGLQVKGYYRFTDVPVDPWKEINTQQPQDNTGEGEWDLTGHVFAGCREAQLRFDLLDPGGKYLATGYGDTILIDVEPPVVLAHQPPPGVMVCAGDYELIAWTLPPASCGSANPDSIALWVELTGQQIVPIVYGLPGTTTQYLWRVFWDRRSDADARIVIEVWDEAGNSGQDMIHPIGYNMPATVTVDPGGDPAGFFPVGGGAINPFDAHVEEGSLPGAFGLCTNGAFEVEFLYIPQEGMPPGADFVPDPEFTLPGVYPIDFAFEGQVIPFTFALFVMNEPPVGSAFAKAAQVDTFRAIVRSTVGAIAEYSEDMLVFTGAISGAEVPPAITRDELVSAVPNPFNPATTVLFDLLAPRNVRMEIYDVAGRRVRTLLAGEYRPAGRNQVVWQGRDDSGRQVASGTYLVRMRTEATEQTLRIALVR